MSRLGGGIGTRGPGETNRTEWEMDKSKAKADKVDRSAVKTFWQRAVEAGRLPKGKYNTPISLSA